MHLLEGGNRIRTHFSNFRTYDRKRIIFVSVELNPFAESEDLFVFSLSLRTAGAGAENPEQKAFNWTAVKSTTSLGPRFRSLSSGSAASNVSKRFVMEKLNASDPFEHYLCF